MILKTAWRNIWRNKRRTIITISSALFAVFFAIIMRSMQLGTYSKMIGDVVNAYTGYIQIHKKGYWDDKIIDNAFDRDIKLEDKLSEIGTVKNINPRLESFALSSFGKKTKGAMIIGIIPEKEKQMNDLGKKIIKGEFKLNENEALIAQGLAKYLNLTVGDTLVLIGQGYHGVSAAGKYAVSGILKFPSPDLNKMLVYLPLNTAQELYGAYGKLTSWSISVSNDRQVKKTMKKINKLVNSDTYEVMSWRKMLIELVQAIQTDNISGQIMLAILYIIIGFGIFGTIVMMTAERKREFGVLIALGMHRKQIVKITIVETLLLGVLGVILGAILSLPIVYYYHVNPIQLTGAAAQSMINFGVEPVMQFALQLHFIMNQAYIVFAILFLCMFYPLIQINRLNLIKAIRH